MSYRVGVVGATGAVGIKLLDCLSQGRIPIHSLKLFASPKSLGNVISFQNRSLIVEVLHEACFQSLDIIFFVAGSSVSQYWIPIATKYSCWIIDNSSCFRNDPLVPLIIPEINGFRLHAHTPRLIANPNCTTIIALIGLHPLDLAFGLKGFCICTYQSVSGAGRAGIQALHSEIIHAENIQFDSSLFKHPIAHNLFPEIGPIAINGFTTEETKIATESRKILDKPHLRVSATCVRVPIFQSHSLAIHAQFEHPVDLKVAQQVMNQTNTIQFYSGNYYPTPLMVINSTQCHVGRLRIDSFIENGLALWVVGDQLVRGAAYNAYQIAHHIHQYLLSK